MRAFVIDITTNLVENVIEFDTAYGLPGKLIKLATDSDPEGIGIGSIYDPNTQTISGRAVQRPPTNTDILHVRLKGALQNNADFLFLATPTNAQVVQQVRALTRQVSALAKLTLRELSDTAGT